MSSDIAARARELSDEELLDKIMYMQQPMVEGLEWNTYHTEILRRLNRSAAPVEEVAREIADRIITETRDRDQGTAIALSLLRQHGYGAQGQGVGPWNPIATAPKNASEMRVKMRDGTIYEKAHWAEDLSGSDQPPFKGWFIPDRYSGFTGIEEPEFWQPLFSPVPSPKCPKCSNTLCQPYKSTEDGLWTQRCDRCEWFEKWAGLPSPVPPPESATKEWK